MNRAYVIMCNDSVEYVILNDRVEAERALHRMRQLHFDVNSDLFENDFCTYKARVVWHIFECGCSESVPAMEIMREDEPQESWVEQVNPDYVS